MQAVKNVRASSSIKLPEITRIVRIKPNESWVIPFIQEEILKNENERNLLPFKTVEDYFGYGVLVISKARDNASFREYQAGTEGRSSQSGDSSGNEVRNGRGSNQHGFESNRTDFTTGEIEYSFPDTIDANSVLDRVRNGELTNEQAMELLSKAKKDDPFTIARLTPEDANTTPDLGKPKGKGDGAGESKFFESLNESQLITDEVKERIQNNTCKAASGLRLLFLLLEIDKRIYKKSKNNPLQIYQIIVE